MTRMFYTVVATPTMTKQLRKSFLTTADILFVAVDSSPQQHRRQIHLEPSRQPHGSSPLHVPCPLSSPLLMPGTSLSGNKDTNDRSRQHMLASAFITSQFLVTYKRLFFCVRLSCARIWPECAVTEAFGSHRSQGRDKQRSVMNIHVCVCERDAPRRKMNIEFKRGRYRLLSQSLCPLLLVPA